MRPKLGWPGLVWNGLCWTRRSARNPRDDRQLKGKQRVIANLGYPASIGFKSLLPLHQPADSAEVFVASVAVGHNTAKLHSSFFGLQADHHVSGKGRVELGDGGLLRLLSRRACCAGSSRGGRCPSSRRGSRSPFTQPRLFGVHSSRSVIGSSRARSARHPEESKIESPAVGSLYRVGVPDARIAGLRPARFAPGGSATRSGARRPRVGLPCFDRAGGDCQGLTAVRGSPREEFHGSWSGKSR
jgi:hypothetical protein